MDHTASVIVRDHQNRILLIHEAYGLRRFGPPGGRVEPGESPSMAALRELNEETGTQGFIIGQVFRGDFIGIYGEPFRAHVFSARLTAGVLAAQDPAEIHCVDWYSVTEFPAPLTLLAERLLSEGSLLL